MQMVDQVVYLQYNKFKKKKRCTFCYAVMALILKNINKKSPTKNKSLFPSSVVTINYYIYHDRVCNRFLEVVIFGLTGNVVNSWSQFIFASRQC